jgi:hypothetical protein
VDPVVSPSQKALEEHLATADFRLGEAEGRWKHLATVWPHAVIEVTAAERANAPPRYAFRFELSGYAARPRRHSHGMPRKIRRWRSMRGLTAS